MDNKKSDGWSQWLSAEEQSVSYRVRQQERTIMQSNPTLLKKQQTTSKPVANRITFVGNQISSR